MGGYRLVLLLVVSADQLGNNGRGDIFAGAVVDNHHLLTLFDQLRELNHGDIALVFRVVHFAVGILFYHMHVRVPLCWMSNAYFGLVGPMGYLSNLS